MPTTDPHAIVELRQYTLHPQQREVLIDLFEREFVETQEALGMPVLGQFRDLDWPDQFVWLRSFADVQARHRALGAACVTHPHTCPSDASTTTEPHHVHTSPPHSQPASFPARRPPSRPVPRSTSTFSWAPGAFATQG